ncbi:general secretion pathway protein GspK [Lysobacter sp. S4-A87]|uniref:general secretion pathway protein GspK n=1 Tax=Lysobacter sp. S4-A87 TaxID=2925843 RepID=UPI001F539B9D|nr:type II secretion system protein GspK [Lysobacter sp. S4-A87]UNK48926.1 general secretion pathway protein GspK [Lysobacter sp. S4-A87]
MSAQRSRMHGTALILVLWLIVLLTSVIGAFALMARIESLQGRVLVRGLVASGAARAGVEYALTRVGLSDPRLKWRPDGTAYRWRYGDADVEVKMTDESGKVDLNQADAQLLAALIQGAGRGEGGARMDATQAARLAGAIIDWRDSDPLTQPAGGGEDADYASAGLPYGAKDGEFESVAELEQVIGFTPQLYARLEPNLTVYSGRARPDPAYAAGPVLDALGLNGADLVAQRGRNDANGLPQGEPPDIVGVAGGGSGTYSIDSRARLTDGRESLLRVVVRVGGGALPGMAYTPLRWEEGASPR